MDSKRILRWMLDDLEVFMIDHVPFYGISNVHLLKCGGVVEGEVIKERILSNESWEIHPGLRAVLLPGRDVRK